MKGRISQRRFPGGGETGKEKRECASGLRRITLEEEKQVTKDEMAG